ncbi:MAG: thioesterase II family protein [Bacillota bacterium]
MKNIRLFCLPYAGGSASVYLKWKKDLEPDIELIPMELAGRGKRFTTPLYTGLPETIQDLYLGFKNDLDSRPYAFMGHSMGSLLAYELARKIKALNHQGPVHAFLSGRYPPHITKTGKTLHALPPEQFKKEIMEIGGTPQEVMGHKELWDVFYPILRADYQILETYEFRPEDRQIDCDLTIFHGAGDKDVTREEVLQWRQYTTKSCRFRELEGGHFFLFEQGKTVVEEIRRILSRN